MKSQKSMRLLALAQAVEKDIRIISAEGKRYAGYCLTESELETVYYREGFNPKTALRHAAMWVKSGDVIILRASKTAKAFYFFVLNGMPELVERMADIPLTSECDYIISDRLVTA